jgi:small subunit ribosomal protein S16
MAVKLRLQRRGRKGSPFYHIVAADSRSPRDGRFIEKIGTYNPITIPATIELNRDRAYYWINVGAQPTDTVRAILRYKGVLYQKHLQKGVAKGAFDQATADQMLAKWLEQKEAAIVKARESHMEGKRKAAEKMNGVAKVKAKPTPPPVEEEAPVAEEVAAEATEAVEAAAEVAEPVVEEAAPAVEAPAAEEAEKTAE